MVEMELLNSLPDRMAAHAKEFDNLLRLIPTKHYMPQKKDETNNPYMHNKRKKAPKQEIKERTKKAKKAKFDPDNHKSISEMQTEQAKEEAQKAAGVADGVDSDSDNDGSETGRSTTISNHSKKTKLQESSQMGQADFSDLASDQPKETPAITEPISPMVKGDIEDLHKRLQQRIADLRKRRNAPNLNSDARSRDEILTARQKRREEQKKALKERKEKGKKAAIETLVQDKSEKVVPNHNQKDSSTVNMAADMMFGIVDVGEQKKKKGPTDAKSLLKMAEAKKEKIEKLKAEDKEKAKELIEKEEWQKAIAMASGEKIRDDPKLLKKAIKRTEHQKKKSAEEWQKRLEKVKEDEQRKIKKREENIKNRKENSKKGKASKGNKSKGNNAKGAKKKARHGFEGAPSGFGGRVTKKSKK